MNERFKKIRLYLNLTQEEFGEKIGIKSRAHISALESGKRSITDRIISDICREFNANEEWLRNGVGEMFIEPDTFSLDEYVKQRGATEFQLDLIKAILEMPEELQKGIISHFKNSLQSCNHDDNDITATIQENFEDYKKNELDAYAQELEAESKGGTLSVLGKPKGA